MRPSRTCNDSTCEIPLSVTMMPGTSLAFVSPTVTPGREQSGGSGREPRDAPMSTCPAAHTIHSPFWYLCASSWNSRTSISCSPRCTTTRNERPARMTVAEVPTGVKLDMWYYPMRCAHRPPPAPERYGEAPQCGGRPRGSSRPVDHPSATSPRRTSIVVCHPMDRFSART